MIRLRPRNPPVLHSVPPDAVGPALQALREAFGTDVMFHPADPPAAVCAGRNGRDAGTEVRRLQPLLKGVRPCLVESVVREATSRSVARELDDGRILLGVPIQGTDRPAGVATAILSPTRSGLAVRLAETALALNASRQDVVERDDRLRLFAEHLSHSLEEVTWFRTLAGSLDFCTPDNGLEDVAAQTFPTLRDVLQAEAVVLVVSGADRHSTNVSLNAIEFPTWIGTPVISREHCREFVASIVAGAHSHPFVWNFGGITEQDYPFHPGQEIRSCILAEIRDRSRHFGWILALNRLPSPYDIRDGRTGELATMGCDEFGTVEATLVTSAARLLATHATNVGLIRDQRNLTVSVIRSMINVLDARDRYTCGHSDRVALSARALAERLGLSVQEQEQIYLAGLLHDVGKVAVPDDVLLKPGALTPEEMAVVQLHPQRGVDILQHIKQLRPMLPGVLHHHESWNGGGYPHGLAGEAIPLMGRVIAVADAFDAMTTCRPYRNARPAEEAAAILREGAGRQWDPRIVPVFLDHLGELIQGAGNWERHIARILNPEDELDDELCGALDDSVVLSGALSTGP